MDLDLTDDGMALVGAAREYLEKRYPPDVVRRMREHDGFDRERWTELATQGWLGMSFPERYGGGGASLLDLGLFCEQAGRVVLPGPWSGALHAGLFIAGLGTPEQIDAHLPRLLSGELLTTVAVTENPAGQGPQQLRTAATADDGWTLSGTKTLVPHASFADQLIVVAAAPRDGVGAFLVPVSAPGAHVRTHITIGHDHQGLVTLTRARLDDTALLGDTTDPTHVSAALARTDGVMTALTVMEMVGGAARVLELTVEHVSARYQFDRPIGSFQAVQHHAANMAIAVHGARLAALQALWLVSEDLPAGRELAIAKSAANDAYVDVTLTAHQLHGGMGIVRDHDLHLWSAHARATSLRLGTTAHHLDRIATHHADVNSRKAR